MEPISIVDLGPLDAGTYDKNFLDKYVEGNNFRMLIGDKYSIITGDKGSGKTALIKGLHLKHHDLFTHRVELMFNDMSFVPVVDNLMAVASTSNLDALRLITNYWRYALVVEAMKAVIGSRTLAVTPTEMDIHRFLVANNHIEEDIFSRLLNLSLKAWQLLQRLTVPSKSKLASDAFPGLSPPPSSLRSKTFRCTIRPM